MAGVLAVFAVGSLVAVNCLGVTAAPDPLGGPSGWLMFAVTVDVLSAFVAVASGLAYLAGTADEGWWRS